MISNTNNNDDRPFKFKVGNCNGQKGGSGLNAVTLMPPACTAKDGTQYTELSDPKREQFILRIGKKAEGFVKKNNIELDLCVPERPVIIPPPVMCDREIQYDIADVGATEKPKKGKGGKGGKGKKGKKGKK